MEALLASYSGRRTPLATRHQDDGPRRTQMRRSGDASYSQIRNGGKRRCSL